LLKRPKLPQPAITYNQFLKQSLVPKTATEPHPNFHRDSIRSKVPNGRFKDFLMKTMIPMEEHNRREKGMSPKQRKEKWRKIREEAKMLDNVPDSAGITVDADGYKQYKKAKRLGYLDG